MSAPTIRPLSVEDLDEALRLSVTAGWNQRLDDWRTLLRIAPAGAFAAVCDARDVNIIGTAIGIDYGGFGWIAMMLVDPAYRGRGVGGRLLEAAMGAVPSNLPIRLDATPAGRPLYQRYGFEDEAMLSRHVRAVVGADSAGTPEPRNTGTSEPRPLTAADLEIVIERDREIFGGSRGALLDWAYRDAPRYAHVVQSGDGLMHYCLGRRGRLFDQIGPVVAGDEDTALALVRAALVAAGDRPVVVDAFDPSTLRQAQGRPEHRRGTTSSGSSRAQSRDDSLSDFAAGLRAHGFHVERPLYRMCRPAGTGACETANRRERPLVEFAILGPEFA